MSSGPSISRANRKRKKLEITLSDAARAQLDGIAELEETSRSAVLERMILRWVRTAPIVPAAAATTALPDSLVARMPPITQGHAAAIEPHERPLP